MSFMGHIHIPHLPHGDPWHRHDINKNIRGGSGYKRAGFASMNSTELRFVLGVLGILAIGVMVVVVI